MHAINHLLVQQKVLIVINKQEKALVIKELLRPFAAQVQVALSMTDALSCVKSSLPYLILCEHALNDGDSFVLQQRLKTESWFSKVSMLVIFPSKTDKDFDVCKQKGMIPVVSAQLDAKVMSQLFKKLMEMHGCYSPFSLNLSQRKETDAHCVLSFPGTIMGKLHGLLVVRSTLIPKPSDVIRCVPKDDSRSACLLSQGVAIQSGAGVFNLFAMTHLQGDDLGWIGALPELKLGAKAPTSKSVLYMKSSAYNDQKYEALLTSLGYQCVVADQWNVALEKFSKGNGQYKIILTTEMPSSGVTEAFGRLPEGMRPVCIVVSETPRISGDPFVRHMTLPFGYGAFADMLEAASLRGDFLEKANAQGNINGAGMPVSLHVDGILHTLDEIGGVVETPLAVQASSEFEFMTLFDSALNRDIRKISVASIKPDLNDVCFHIRFEAKQLAMSQMQFLGRLAKVS